MLVSSQDWIVLDISRQIVYKFTISLIASLNDGPEIKVMTRVKTIYYLNKLIEGTFSWKLVIHAIGRFRLLQGQ